MTEKKLVIDQLRLNYEGLFSLNELYRTVSSWFYEHGYDYYEKKNVEQVTPTGKDIEIELRPWKKLTDYAKKELKIRMFLKDVKMVEVEKEGVKLKLNQGNIQMIFDAYLITDYEDRWENKPLFFFIRTLVDKYVYKFYTDRFEGDLVDDVHQVHQHVKAHLNLFRY